MKPISKKPRAHHIGEMMRRYFPEHTATDNWVERYDDHETPAPPSWHYTAVWSLGRVRITAEYRWQKYEQHRVAVGVARDASQIWPRVEVAHMDLEPAFLAASEAWDRALDALEYEQ